MTFGPHNVAGCEYTYNDKVTCGNRVSQKVYEYSIEKFGKVLCYGHQKQLDLPTSAYTMQHEKSN